MAKKKIKTKTKKRISAKKPAAGKRAGVKNKRTSAKNKQMVAKKAAPRKITVRKAIPKTAKTIKIGVFGGTFNPVHFGHLNSIETISEKMKFDKMWIVPNFKNPLRPELQGPTAEQRINMVKLAIPEIGKTESEIEVRNDEVDRGGDSYTAVTISDFAKKNKGAEFYLIVGADQIENFHNWKDFGKILEKSNLVVTSRPGSQLPQDRDELPGWMQSLVKSFKAGKVTLKTGKHILFCTLNDIEISASDIRRRLRRRESVSHLVPAKALEYINENGLYDPKSELISDYQEFTKFCCNLLNDKGGLNICAYDLRQLEQLTEFTIVVSGTSTRHAKALCENILEQAKARYDIYPQATEGLNEGRWVVIDYGSLMIHIFYDFVRQEFRLEELWSEASRIQLS